MMDEWIDNENHIPQTTPKTLQNRAFEDEPFILEMKWVCSCMYILWEASSEAGKPPF